MKFGRTYELVVEGQNSSHTFRFPTTIRFDVDRNIFAKASEAQFTIINANENSRKDIYLDRSLGYAEYRKAQFSVGYVSNTVRPIIFKGNVKVAYSEKQGSSILTQISALDGGHGMTNGFVSITRPKGWNFVDVVREAMKSMPHVGIGTITQQAVPNSRGITLNGASWTQLQRMAAINGSYAFIDNEVAHLLTQKGTIADSSGIKVIQSSTGLLGIPRKIGNQVTVSMILEPRLVIGNLVLLNSELNPSVNGAYKVIGFHHSGTISGVESGDATTDLTLLDQKAPEVA